MIKKLIFPKPDPPTYSTHKFLGEIIYVSRQQHKLQNNIKDESDFIPCLFLPYLHGSEKLVIFFHGNAEDLGISYELLDHLRN